MSTEVSEQTVTTFMSVHDLQRVVDNFKGMFLESDVDLVQNFPVFDPHNLSKDKKDLHRDVTKLFSSSSLCYLECTRYSLERAVG